VSALGPFLRHFASELRRRRVLRVAGAYAAMAFIAAQVGDIAFPALGLPPWALTLVIVLLLIGFPFALVMAWLFDVTPGGVRRTEAAESGGQDDSAGSVAPAPRFRSRASGAAVAAATLILALAGAAFMMQEREQPEIAAAEAERELSIAVLPFTNQSSEPDSEYFSDGVTEAIQLRLNRIGNLRVTSITSVMTYRGSSKRMQEIATELGVDHVVEGSVRRVGDRVRISARLVEAATDRTLWSDVLDRPFADLLDIETEIAEQVAAGLQLRLTAAQRGRLARSGTSSVAAYELYMRARKILRESINLDWTSRRATFYNVLALLRQAVEADPGYAVAWAELSWRYLNHVDLPKPVREDSARSMAERAIRLAPDLPDGYVALGEVLRDGNGTAADQAAVRQFELALERDPNHVDALLAYAWHLGSERRLLDQARLLHRAARLDPTNPSPAFDLATVSMWKLGDWEGAIAWLERARAIDPAADERAWWYHGTLAEYHFEAGNRAAAERHRARFLELAPDAEAAWSQAAWLHIRLGEYQAAVPLVERLVASVDGVPHVDGIVPGVKQTAWYAAGWILSATGDTLRGHDFLRRAEQANLDFRRHRCPDGGCSTTSLAMLYAYRGDTERAIEYLKLSVQAGFKLEYPGSAYSRKMFRNISDDPRYQRIMGDFVADFDRQRDAVRREGIHRP
jgi:TolB-like protein/Tfp pilus assembly protein PilF